MRKFSLQLLTVLVVLAGCSSGTETSTTQSSKPAPAPVTTQVVSGEEYTMEIPSDWEVMDMTKLTDASAVEARLKGTRYENALPTVRGLAGGKTVRFFAFIPELVSNTNNGNINLLISPTAADATAVLDENEKQLKGFAKDPEVLQNFSTVPNSRAFAFSMPDMSVKSVVVISVQNGKQYVMTLTAPEGTDYDRAKTIAKEVFNTFKAK